MRMHGHAAHDDMKYVPKEKVEEWQAKDPIDRQDRAASRRSGSTSQPCATRSRPRSTRPSRGARRSPMPDGDTATDGVFADEPALLEDGNAPWSGFQGGRRLMPTMTYLQAISDAMREEMRADERVFVMGEDIGIFGGAFKVTDGFIDEFGPQRVMDTPLAESAIVGCAIGAAVRGPAADRRDAVLGLHLLRLRPARQRRREDVLPAGPVGEHHRAAALAAAASPAARTTPRTPRRWFLHSPGLKVVAPSTAEDAKGLLIAAVRDPNPVLFMEHKHLYRRVKGEVPEGSYETPFTARIAREGTDLTVIAYGAMVHTALEATEDIDGASIEVLDLRSLVPLDEEAILDVGAQDVEGRDRRRGQPDVRRRRAGGGADRRARLGGPRRAGRARRHARTCRSRSRPPLEQAVLPAGRRREGGVP